MTETPRRGAFHPRGTLASALGRGPIPTSEDSVDASKMADAAAAYVAAVQAVQRAGIGLRGDVILAHVVGELQGGVGTVHMLERGVRADRFVVGEPTDNTALTLHAGSLEAELTTHGRTRHLSKMEEGVDAIAKMFRVIPALNAMSFSGPERADYRGLRRVGIGLLRGGTGPEYQDWRPSLLADRCSIKFSARYSPGQTPEMVAEDIRAPIAHMQKDDPDLVADVRLNQGGQRMLMGPFEVAREADIVQAGVPAPRR